MGYQFHLSLLFRDLDFLGDLVDLRVGVTSAEDAFVFRRFFFFATPRLPAVRFLATGSCKTLTRHVKHNQGFNVCGLVCIYVNTALSQ